MKKKVLACFLALTLTAGMMTGCGGEKKPAASDANVTPSVVTTGDSIIVSGGDVAFSVDPNVVSAAKPVSTGDLYVSESMVDMGIVRPGNVVRIAAAMEKAVNGGTVTIGFVGGSIALGAGASSPDNSYAGLVTNWWKTTFPAATINVVNLGMYNGDSYIQAHRINDELLSASPDVVILDTASEDVNANSEDGFESMVRMILGASNKPAVVPLITTNSTYRDDGTFQQGVAFKYDLPTISYAQVLQKNVDSGTWKWSDVSKAELTLEPADPGHAFIAHLLTSYFTKILKGIPDSKYTEFYVEDVTNTSTMCRYANSSQVQYRDKMSIDGDWTNMDLPSPSDSHFTTGIGTSTGSSCHFTVTGKQIGLLFYKSNDGGYGQFNVYLDGELVTTLDGDLSAYEDQNTNFVEYYELGTYSASTAHEVIFEKSAESTGDIFTIVGFTLSS